MKSLMQCQISHISNKNPASGSEYLQGIFNDTSQILQAGEILDDRVQNDSVAGSRDDLPEIVRGALDYCQLRQAHPGAFFLPADTFKGGCRNIGGVILLAIGSQSKKQQSRATSDFNHSSRLECRDN